MKQGGFSRKIVGTRSYIAPEVYGQDYGQKCDVWSIGVMTYLFLGGSLPFNDRNSTQKETEEAIKKGEFSLEGGVWDSVSTEAKNFIRNLLVLLPHKRPSAQEALHLPWIKNLA